MYAYEAQRKIIFPFLACALILSPWALQGAEANPEAEQLISYLESYYGPGVAQSRTFAGSEICLACHPGQEGWRTSMHATGFNVTSTDRYSLQDKFGVVLDYDRNGVDDFVQGLDFNTINSVFDKYKPNAPVLGYDEQLGYTTRIGQVTLDSRFAYGGSGLYKQRFVYKVPTVDGPDGYARGHYVGPVQYNEVTGEYVPYNPQDWWNDDGTPIFTPESTMADLAEKGRSFDKKCAGCHFTGFTVSQSAEGEWMATGPPAIVPAGSPHYYDMNDDGFVEEINTGCERCHGAGTLHILGRGDPEKIINPATDLSTHQANQICGSCHSRGKSLPNKVFDYPYDEDAGTGYQFALGEELYDKYWTDAAGRWPDGRSSKQHHQQYQEFITSSKPTHESENVRCFDCHNVHVDNLHHIRGTIVEEGADEQEIEIAAKVEDNTLCLSCHATEAPFEALTKEDITDPVANRDKIAGVVEAHTHHPYGPERILGLSRCTTCHMPKITKSAINYDIASHTFEAVPPEKTLMYQDQGGMPNACATCHRDFARLFGQPIDSSLTDWAEASDVRMSEFLMQYYGPEGIWWKTGEAEEGGGDIEPAAAAPLVAPTRSRSSR